MKNLPIDLNIFPFYKREQVRGRTIRNRCGRDFLCYSLAYYFPDKFGLGRLTAYELEHHGYFGVSVPAYLAWTQIQFLRAPKYLKELGLQIVINDRPINSFSDFVRAILFSRMDYKKAISDIEKTIDRSEVAGIDIAVGFGGLLDHVSFVHGYDTDNLYTFETTKTPIQFESIDKNHPQVMRLPKREIQKRWTRFGRVWNVKTTKN